jgi:hypothetical protein
VLNPDDSQRAVWGTANLGYRLVSHDLEGVRQLGRLAAEVSQRVSARVEQLRGDVEAEAKAWPLDDLYALPPLQHDIPGPDAASRRR